jgi:hypothetical protein
VANGAVSGTNVLGGNYCIYHNPGLLLDTSVFGMPLEQVESIADDVGDNHGNVLTVDPNRVGLWYFSGNLTYDPSLPPPYNSLVGSGILVVDGPLSINSQGGASYNLFNGVIFCTGNVWLDPNSIVQGAIILGETNATNGQGKGQLIITGVTDYKAQLIANPSYIVQKVMPNVSTYRLSGSPRKSFLNIPNW